MNQKVNIRDYTPKDCQAVQGLMQQLGYTIDRQTLSQSITNINATKGKVFVAEIDNIVIACAHALIETRLAEGELGELVSLIVDRNHQGKKIGRSLSQHVETYLRNCGCKNIRIRMNTLRTNAHQFYKQSGFEIVKQQVVFEKPIDTP